MATQAKPDIFLLSLAMQSFLDESYSALIDQLSLKSSLKRAKSAQGALNFLSTNAPRAIIATDEGLANPVNVYVLEKVLTYVRSGGLLIIGLHFPNFIDMDAFNSLFQKLGLPWERGDYHRTTFCFNVSAALPEGVKREAMPQQYSMKALHVKGARSGEKVFVPVPEAMTQSMVFRPAYVDGTQAAVVTAKLGEGFVVYDGNVNPEEGQIKVVLALCRL